MGEPMKRLKMGRISFASPRPLQRESVALAREPPLVAKEHSLDTPKSPLEAMEYLSRSWSSSSSDFSQMLSLNSLLPPSEDSDRKLHGDEVQGEATKKEVLLGRESKRMRVDGIWTWLSNGRPTPSANHKHKPHRISWTNLGHMKTWLGGDLLGRLSRTCKEKRKEELRLHMAQVHAALSVAQLAAAVAGIMADSGLHRPNGKNVQTGHTLNTNMDDVVASAAALVATVCAEAAESAGASKARIACAINSGLAAQSPADMLTLTATAATCLRGAATLKLRISANRHASEEGQVMLAKGAELPIRTPLGKIHLRMVWVYHKRGKLILRLGKKYLQGALTRCKEYRIIEAVEETKEGSITNHIYGFCLLTIGTSGGTIEVLFDDERQRALWKSTISHLLCDHEMFSL